MEMRREGRTPAELIVLLLLLIAVTYFPPPPLAKE